MSRAFYFHQLAEIIYHSPRRRLHPVHPSRLSSSAFHPYYFLPFLSDPFINGLVLENDSLILKWNWLPFGKYALYNEFINPLALQGGWQILRNKQSAYFSTGTYPVPTGAHLFKGYEEFTRNHPAGINCILRQKDIEGIKSILDLAKANGILVIVYIPPYFKEVNKYISCEEKNNQLKSFVLKSGNKFWQFDTLPICKSRNWFVSAFHTNPEGSKIFTTALSEKLLKE